MSRWTAALVPVLDDMWMTGHRRVIRVVSGGDSEFPHAIDSWDRLVITATSPPFAADRTP